MQQGLPICVRGWYKVCVTSGVLLTNCVSYSGVVPDDGTFAPQYFKIRFYLLLHIPKRDLLLIITVWFLCLNLTRP